MITIFNATKNTYPLTDEQRSELLRSIAEYSKTNDGKWLNDIDYSGLEYLWKSDLENTDVQAIRPLFGKKIILQPNENNTVFWAQIMASPAIHELRHIYQRKRLGLLVYCLLAPIGRIPGLAEKAPLEKDAFKHQDWSLEVIGRLK